VLQVVLDYLHLSQALRHITQAVAVAQLLYRVPAVPAVMVEVALEAFPPEQE
jgi:hypothetical protein